ncbi:MAG TPA: hypothetical protein VGE74_21075 [Gemmata sp.]
MNRSALRLLVAVVCVSGGSALAPVSGADGAPVEPMKTWQGEIRLDLRAEAPKDDYVADKAAWEKLRKSYCPKEKAPEIDFAKDLVLIALNKDPNRISIGAHLGADGNLTVRHVSTKIAFQNPTTCKYQFAVIPREGIKSINGKPLGGK